MKVKFIKNAPPVGLAYFAGDVADFDSKQAAELISLEYAEEYIEPVKEVVIDLPDDLPGRKKLIDVGIKTLEELKQFPDLTEIKGIGKALAKTIENYFEE